MSDSTNWTASDLQQALVKKASEGVSVRSRSPERAYTPSCDDVGELHALLRRRRP